MLSQLQPLGRHGIPMFFLFRPFAPQSSLPSLMTKVESASLKAAREREATCSARRLNFLWYMLNQNDDTMLLEFLRAQCENPVKGDWVLTVQKDLDELEISESFDDIRETTKDAFKK